MSENTALTELARFVGSSNLVSDDTVARNRALAGITQRLQPRKRSVSELLGVVMVLSSRTRRMVQDPVSIDLDVFAPGGARAVRLTFGR